ncbi:hypothetical protein [uncultured Mediterranean phage uvMED]|nr:hypothetical protein [uncultured Mediterranean phage uvMED]
MIAEFIILILLQAIMLYIVITIGVNQETNHKSNYRTQDDMFDEITQIRRTVRAIDRTIKNKDYE